MDNFYVLSGIYWLEVVIFRQLVNSIPNQVQSTKWHSVIHRLMQSTCNLLTTPGLFQCLSCIYFWSEFEHSSSSFMQSIFAKRQFEFVVFVSYIVLRYFILWSTHSVTKYIFFISSIDWMLWALLQSADAGGLVTWQGLYPWISGSSLPYNQKP